MRVYQLNDSRSVVLDAAGSGMVSLGPTQYGVDWKVTNVSVSCEPVSQTVEPECRTYRGGITPQQFHGGTYSGSMDSNSDPFTLLSGEKLYAVWTGGVPGAVATIAVFGEEIAKGAP